MTRVAVILALLAAPAAADMAPDRVSLLLGSHHVDARTEFVERNPGLFLTWDGAVDVSVGAYRNSYGETSVAAMAALPLVAWDGGEASVFAGVAHYPNDGEKFATHIGSDVVVLGGVQVRHGNLFAQVIPSDGVWADAIVSVGLTMELGQ